MVFLLCIAPRFQVDTKLSSATEGGVRVEGQEPAHCLENSAAGYSFTQNSFLSMLR